MEINNGESLTLQIPLVDIHANEEFNCRGKIAPIDVVHLSKSFERDGQISPVVVAPYSDEYKKEAL